MTGIHAGFCKSHQHKLFHQKDKQNAILIEILPVTLRRLFALEIRILLFFSRASFRNCASLAWRREWRFDRSKLMNGFCAFHYETESIRRRNSIHQMVFAVSIYTASYSAHYLVQWLISAFKNYWLISKVLKNSAKWSFLKQIFQQEIDIVEIKLEEFGDYRIHLFLIILAIHNRNRSKNLVCGSSVFE